MCDDCKYVVSLYKHWDRGDWTAMLNWFRSYPQYDCVYLSVCKIMYAKGIL